MFEASRAAEYFDARELQAMTGQPRNKFATVALKELVDNALDACETAGVEPEIGIKIYRSSGENTIRITVTDNGPGIPPETVDKVLDFGVRVSDKAAYRSPTRGAQGNALKTVAGIPYAIGIEEPLNIEGQGVRHEIRPSIDPAGTLRIKHAKSEANARETYKGSAVTLTTIFEDQEFEPDYWAAAFAMFNPHATVTFEHLTTGRRRTEFTNARWTRLGGSMSRPTSRRRTGTHRPRLSA